MTRRAWVGWVLALVALGILAGASGAIVHQNRQHGNGTCTVCPSGGGEVRG